MKVAQIGLGNIGAILASNLLDAGYELIVHDLDPDRAGPLLEKGARWADTPLEAARAAQRVVTSLPSPEAVRAVMTGPKGVLEGLQAGAVWIETSTTDVPQLKAFATEAWARGADALEATLTLGVHRMADRTGTIFAGGAEAVFNANADLLRDMGGEVIHIGPLGQASIIKIITNTIAFVNLIGLAEGMALADKSGIDLATAHKAISASFGHSYVNETEMKVVLNGSFDGGFTIDLACKDLRLSQALSAGLGMRQPITEAVGEIWETIRHAHGDRAFSAEAVRHVEDHTGTTLRAPGFPGNLMEISSG